MNFWKKLQLELKNGHAAVLMYVLQSEGSSPGRQGFKMFVSASGLMAGSIGGGIMEFKLVEFCRSELLAKPFAPFIKKQIHRRDIPKDRSGMICAGEQLVAFYRLDAGDLALAENIAQSFATASYGILTLNEEKIEFDAGSTGNEKYRFSIEKNNKWRFSEDLGFSPKLYIAGAGHVSLAVCRMAAHLGFEIHVLDDRTDLNTAPPAELASHTRISDYAKIADHIPEGENNYVVLMSFGYRTDKIILQNLLGRKYRYLGMMGSTKKVETLFAELEAEGFDRAMLNRVHSPIGLQIHSRTPAEIAVSILAELIAEKNRYM